MGTKSTRSFFMFALTPAKLRNQLFGSRGGGVRVVKELLKEIQTNFVVRKMKRASSRQVLVSKQFP